MADQFRTGIDWEDLRVFLALARHGSLSGAARALAVNHATVARRLKRLEETLGARLAERRPGGYELTAAGRGALEAADAMDAAARTLPRPGAEAPLAGLVRITATPGLADGYLVPRLAGLRTRHPGLDVELIADRRTISLARHEADIALRLGRPADGELVARRVAVLGFGFYADAAWRQRIESGETPVFVGFDEGGAAIPEARWLARRFPGGRLAFRASGHVAQVAAARAGYGLALLPHFLARAEGSGLVRVLPAESPPDRELWLLTRRDPAPASPVRTVREFLIELFRRDHDLFGPE